MAGGEKVRFISAENRVRKLSECAGSQAVKCQSLKSTAQSTTIQTSSSHPNHGILNTKVSISVIL